MDDPIALKFFRTQRQAVVPFPKNGAFATVIDKDEGLLAGTPGSHEEMSFDPRLRKFRAMEFGRAVVPDLAHVASAQAPLLAGNHGGSDLAAREHLRGSKFYFGPARGIVRDGNESIGSVEPHADNIKLG